MERVSFNNNWKVWKDLDPFELVFRVPADAKEVDLPYDAMLHETQKEGTLNGGYTGNIDAGEYKFYKEFFVPEEDKDKRLLLQFEGIYRNALVFVNQSKVGESPYGYSDFTVEIGDYVKYGETNVVLVLVKCGTRNSRWYSGAGIYRDAWLHKGNYVYVNPYELRLTTLEADAEGALVCVSAQVHNDTHKAGTFAMTVEIAEADGTVVKKQTYPVRMKSAQTLEFRKNIYLEQAKLWDEETPHLYTVKFTIADEAGVLDESEITTGIRKLSLDAKHGLRVNGKSVKLRGACIHHDQGILGSATYDAYEYRRVKRLKEAGFNAVRSAHNPASQALLRACDALGMYVMDELVDVWNKSKVSYDYSVDFERCWEQDVERMVAADYNHPSVIMYSTGNEIFEICTEKGFETSRMLSDKYHALDPSRFTTNGINGAFAAGDGLKDIVDDLTNGTADTGTGDVNVFMSVMEKDMPGIVSHPILGAILEKLETTMDIIGYNYMTARYQMDAKAYPDRLMVGSETYPKQIAENWGVITDCSQAIGDFTWTGWDYLGEVTPVFPDLFNTGGDISVIGNRRPTSYYREIVYGLKKGPVIAVQEPGHFGIPRNFGPWCYTDCTFSYAYPKEEGKPIMIQVYAGGDEVELLQNGVSLGKQPCGKATAFETQFQTTYQPGELTAIAYENGVEIGRSQLIGAGAPAQLALQAESYDSLVFVNMDVLDEAGVLAASAAVELSISVEGPAKLLAFGAARAPHKNGFEAAETVSGEGHALAILQRTGEGAITVTVQGDGMQPASVAM